ncbi:MAG TPA: hypothetical protein QGF27_09680 [Arenicellales bacterium]|nr:hypothetical protein [Arenicellales bacterium]HJP10283.1 hypothetical protein [Arenicellales bacterium]
MSGYSEQANSSQLLREFPVGEAFSAGPAGLDAEALRALQEVRFAKVMKRAWQVPFYQRHWGEAGLEPGDIAGLDDLARLPVVTKDDLMDSVERFPPLGDYHGMDRPEGGQFRTVLQTTSGTTGSPQPLFFGAKDREIQNILLARAYLLQGLRSDDVVHSVYGFGMVNGGHYIREAVLYYTDALLLPAGTGTQTRSLQQVELMQRFGATVLVGFGDFLHKLARTANEAGLVPGEDIPLRMISGHVAHDARQALSNAWGGAVVYDWYGVGDTGIVAAEGPVCDGLYIWEDAHYVEIVAPDSGVPVEPGCDGNLCVTVLFKDSVYPIVRFDTQDVSRLLPADSDSGINFQRIAGFSGRSDNMVKLRGVNVYPTAIGSLLHGFSGATGEYVCRLHSMDDQDELTVMLEYDGADPDFGELISRHLRARLGVRLGVEVVAGGETAGLTELEVRQKPRRLIDER